MVSSPDLSKDRTVDKKTRRKNPYSLLAPSVENVDTHVN
jgi:hypothetical protein